MKERDRLNAILLAEKKNNSKDKRKAKLRAKVKVRVKQEMDKYQTQITILIDKMQALHTEMAEYNPRFKPLQMHTKIKWTDDIGDILAGLQALLPKKE